MALLAGKALAKEIARLAIEKKADNLVILDLSKFSAPAEFFVIGTALSAPHLRGLRDHISEELKKLGLRTLHADGTNEGTEWIVLDYFDVIVHLFSKPKRSFYDIEDLYADAPMEACGLAEKSIAVARVKKAQKPVKPAVKKKKNRTGKKRA